jgi:hypothetical protein
MSAFGQDIWWVGAEELSHALKVRFLSRVTKRILTSSAFLGRLPRLQPPPRNDQSYDHPILHPPLSRVYPILPDLLALHCTHHFIHRHPHVLKYLPVHTDTLELGPLWRRRCEFLVHGLEQVDLGNQHYEYHFRYCGSGTANTTCLEE